MRAKVKRKKKGKTYSQEAQFQGNLKTRVLRKTGSQNIWFTLTKISQVSTKTHSFPLHDTSFNGNESFFITY